MSPGWLTELCELENYCSQARQNACFNVLGFLGINVSSAPETVFTSDELGKEAALTCSSSSSSGSNSSGGAHGRITLSTTRTVKVCTSLHVAASLHGHLVNSPLSVCAWPREEEGGRTSLSRASNSAAISLSEPGPWSQQRWQVVSGAAVTLSARGPLW